MTLGDRIYQALRSAVGKGGSARSPAGIDPLWRQCKADAIASVAAMGERSAQQAFPNIATDLLPYYERLLMITSDVGATLEERQAAAAQLYTVTASAALPDVLTQLQRIDERFTLINQEPDGLDTTVLGRAFDDFAGTEPFDALDATRHSTDFPNYSTAFRVYVLLDIGGGEQPTQQERIAIRAAHKVLDDVLPAFNDHQIVTHRGFTLDVDRLDLTSLGA